ncbi:MAG: DUF4166 domain-containing protein [Halioglobus sp.]
MSNLFKDCLGEQFEQLDPLIQQAHTGKVRLVGDVVVERGNLVAQLICNLFGMPPASSKSRLVVLGDHDDSKMRWIRHFDDHGMDSNFYKDGNFLVERLGPIHMKMALSVSNGVLTYALDQTRVLGIPVAKFLSPNVRAIEQRLGDKYRFSVVVAMPIVGMLVSYRGDLEVESIYD